MIFTSSEFLILTFITFILYYLPFLRKFQALILILAGFVFYIYNAPLNLLLLLFSIVLNSFLALQIIRNNKRRKLLMQIGVAVNVGILIFFKYAVLIYTSLFDQIVQNNSIEDLLISIPLPLGISFFTFQSISLLADAYNNKLSDLSNENNTSLIKKIVLYISFFPKLIAGPLAKPTNFFPQIKRKIFNNINWKSVFKIIVWGFFLKVFVADNLRQQTFWMQSPYFLGKSTLTLLVILFGFSIQMFADFAGYSAIAIGVAKLFGYDIMRNFNYPYIANSFSDFWRRWHISLSTWLKNYLYIPLGGNRKGKLRTYLNLMIVMTIGGLWHGATWNFAIWGFAHGIFLIIERFINNHIKYKFDNRIFAIIKVLLVFTLVSFLWLFFKLTDINDVPQFFHALVNNRFDSPSPTIIIFIIFYSLPVVFAHLIHLDSMTRVKEIIRKFSYLFYAAMLFLIILNAGNSSTFIYFQF